MLGVMIDCSRNAVMTCDAVKQYVDLLAAMGYDTLMLYTEDTYEVNNEPYFGYMRGRYTKAELKEMDAYCKSKGIELIPCIQTLAHFNAIFQVCKEYWSIKDCDDILMIDEERTYTLLENIFVTLSECFTSRKVHIGMDEAGKVGLGNYLKKHGYTERFTLLKQHLRKVCEIAGKYGFEPMVWSDMFTRLVSGEIEHNDEGELVSVREKADLPENVALVYWNYYNDDSETYVKALKKNQAFERPVIFAGGAWTWKGFMPDNILSIRNTEAALKACKEQGVKDILMTVWGDDGGECSRFGILPTLLYTAEMMRQNTDIDAIKQKFFDITGMNWDDFALLDQLTMDIPEKNRASYKYLFYNDPFIGISDYRATAAVGAFYENLGKKIEEVSATPQYRLLFDVAAALCRVLAVKTDLGVKTRKAYQAKDRALLARLAERDYDVVIAKAEEFYKVYAAWWNSENKPFGFEIQDIRLGGLIWRLKQCKNRLLTYLEDEAKNIPELEETLLEGTGGVSWTNMVTPNVVSHLFFG